jgi:hypothetical protein
MQPQAATSTPALLLLLLLLHQLLYAGCGITEAGT